MAQQVEVAQLYYTLGAKADASTDAVLSQQGTALDELSAAAQEAGVPLGALQAAVAQLTDEVERELTAAVADMGKQLDATGVSAATLAQRTQQVTEASAASTAALAAQVRVYAAGTQIQSTREQSLAQLAAIEQQLKGRLDSGNLTLEQRIRLEAVLAQTQVATVAALGRTTSAVGTAARGAQTAGAAVKDFGARWSGTALNIVTAASSIVQSGNVSSGGLKSVLLGATSLAGFLGAGGALVVAASVAANAIIGVFTKAREEAKKAADDVATEIARLQNAGDNAGLLQRAQTLFEGTAAGNYKDGLRALRAELAGLDQQIASAGVFGALDSKTKAERDKVAATLKQLEADFERTRQAIENPARPTLPGRTAITVTATSPKADAEAAKRQLEAASQAAAQFRDVQQAVQDLVGSIGTGESVLAAFDRKVREISDAFAKIKAPTAEQRAEFERLQAAAAAARVSLASLEGLRTADELRKIEAALTPSMLDDMAVATRELVKQLQALKAPPEVIARILGLKQALDDAQISGQALDAKLTAIGTSGAGPLRQMVALGELRREKEAELLGITGKSEEAERRRATIHAQIAKIQEAETKLAQGQEIASANTTEHASELLVQLEDAASAAFGIATAFLGADASLTKMIGGTVQMVSGFARIADLAGKAGGYAKLFSTGGGIASALPAIGGILGGVAAFASVLGDSPAQKEQRALLQRNNERLEQLRQTLGDALQLTSSGRTIAGVTRALNATPLPDNPAVEFQRVASIALSQELRKLGLSMADLKQIAKDAGMELSANPTVKELRQLQKYLNDLDFSAFANSFAGAMKKLNVEFELFPDQFKSNVDRFKAIVGELNDKDTGAPALFKGLAGIDTSTAQGKADALAEIQRLFRLLDENKLTAEDLNGLSLQEFFETLTRLKQELGDLPAAKTGAEQFADAMAAFGVQIEFGTLNAQQKLEKAKEAFAKLLPDLAGSLDTSSLDAFKASIGSIIDGFAADGELTDAENAQIAVLRALLQAFEDATPAAERFVDSLSALSDRFEIFGTSLTDQISQILDEVTSDASIGKNAGFGLLKGLTDGLDLATKDGNAELRKRAQAIYDTLAEGGITEEEQAVIDILKRILGLGAQAADDAAKAAEDAANNVKRTAEELAATAKKAAEDARAAIFSLADAFLAVNDITDPVEILKVKARALAKAFPALSDQMEKFDLSTQEGRDALEAWIKSLIDSPDALNDLAKSLGITTDELIRQLLGLESAADDAASKVATLADTISGAFDAVNYSIDLEGITDPVERLKRTAQGIAGIIPEIDDALKGLDLNTESGRSQAESRLIALGKTTTDAAVRDTILKLLGAIRAVPAAGASLGIAGTVSSGSQPQSVDARFSAFAAATVGQADAMLTVLTRIQENTKAVAEFYLRGAGSVRAPVLPQLPQLVASAQFGAGGGFTLNLYATIYIGDGVSPQTVQTALDESGDRLQRQIANALEITGARSLIRSQRNRGIPLQT